MARTSQVFGSLPALSLLVACATAVDQGFVDDDSSSSGGNHASLGGSGNASGSASVAGKATGGGGKAPNAFGGTGSGSGGSVGSAGSGTGGSAGVPSGGGNAGTASAGTDGAGTGGTSAGTAGSSAGNGGAGAGSGGTSAGTGGSSAGNGGSAGSTGSTGECAPVNSGWVVQYWTSTPPANMPAADLRIFNDSGQTVNFSTLELRHYFTNEETATLTFTFSTFGHNFPAAPYYQDENGANVLSSILAVAPPVTGASQYIRITFNATPGTFGPGEYAQLGFYGSVSMYPFKSNQADDYTYVGHPTSDPGSANRAVGWNHLTLYQNGALVWGCEP